MLIQVNTEGVKALREYSAKLEESFHEIKNDTNVMTSVTDQFSGKIGPHADDIKRALDSIRGAVFSSLAPAKNVSDKLLELAEAYQEIIDGDYYGNLGN